MAKSRIIYFRNSEKCRRSARTRYKRYDGSFCRRIVSCSRQRKRLLLLMRFFFNFLNFFINQFAAIFLPVFCWIFLYNRNLSFESFSGMQQILPIFPFTPCFFFSLNIRFSGLWHSLLFASFHVLFSLYLTFHVLSLHLCTFLVFSWQIFQF